ncbi:hypothetical protein BDZ89DRAFT_672104 [Hymenopellis radicata]|nr:hypothetical protein BDZ89DRAFT_672104 [Hymenopellis radicata]
MPSSESEISMAGSHSESESESPIPEKPVKSLWNGELDDAGEEHQDECVMYWDEDQGCLVKGVRFKDAPFNDYRSLCGTYDWVWDGYPERDEQVHSCLGSITLELEAHVDDQDALANLHGTITWGDYRGTYKGFEKQPSVHHNDLDILNPIDWHDTRTDLEPSEDEVHSFALAQVNDESGHPFIIYYFDSGPNMGHNSFGRWGVVGKKRQGAQYATLTHKEELLLGIGSTRSALMKRAGFIPNRG